MKFYNEIIKELKNKSVKCSYCNNANIEFGFNHNEVFSYCKNCYHINKVSFFCPHCGNLDVGISYLKPTKRLFICGECGYEEQYNLRG